MVSWSRIERERERESGGKANQTDRIWRSQRDVKAGGGELRTGEECTLTVFMATAERSMAQWRWDFAEEDGIDGREKER